MTGESSQARPRYDLYWTWTSAAMSCHGALEEIGQPYDLHFIDFNKPWPADYLTLNPNRKVPTLVDRSAGPGQELVI